MSQKFEKLKSLLKELFQLDQPDLDFGVYRILQAKSGEVAQFLENDLLPQVKESFSRYLPADKAAIQAELRKSIKHAEELGADPESLPKIKELRAKLSDEAVDIDALESEVYDHLYSFFRRYYSDGDFISKRVYKEGVYAIPYEGEEVKLHWANVDQYYIKTSEYLRDYAFRLNPNAEKNPWRVHFKLVDAVEGDHGNVKTAEGKERVFILADGGETGRDFISEENGELVINFEYRPANLLDWPDNERQDKTKPPVQKELLKIAANRVLTIRETALLSWINELGKPHFKADGVKADYSRLEAHLNRYAARNTFDYFIHKDLDTFLRRELDFYIKNEVMHLDDIQNETAQRVEQYLSKIKVIRTVAGKIIAFLAQLEDFQKKLWLKKKFVVETQYCITLDRVPEEFYAEIVGNVAQREEWVKLFAIDEIKATGGDLFNGGSPAYSNPLTVEFLKANNKLVLDTRFFSEDFKARLIGTIENFDEQCEGLLIHSENFQALNLLQERYREQVKCVYIDPPYNTEQDRELGKFIYKDNFESSSWLALMGARIESSKSLMMDTSSFFVSIDHNEIASLKFIASSIFGKENFEGLISWRRRHNQPNDKTKMIGMVAEYILGYSKDSILLKKSGVGKLYLTGDFSNPDNDPRGDWASKPWKVGSDQSGSRYIITSPTGIDLDEEWMGEEATYKQYLKEGRIYFPKNGNGGPRKKYYKHEREEEGQCATNWWSHEQFGHNQGANDLMTSLMGYKNAFSNPKPIELLRGILLIANSKKSVILDYFAGSGTTGHAVIDLNREDNGKRKYLLVEMGDYFDTVLKPRIARVVYSSDWKDGKPTKRESGISHCFKYLRLESYEDTLNNLNLKRTEQQQLHLDSAEAQGIDKLKEQYFLRYMLDVESRGSASLLNIVNFTDPTAYTLKVKIPGSDESRELAIDLVETFNYLIGLQITHMAAPQTVTAEFERDSEGRLRIKGKLKEVTTNAPQVNKPWRFRTVTGSTLDGSKILVIWRNRPGGETSEGIEQDNLVLDEWFTKQGCANKDSEFGLIYVNGTNNLENLKTPTDLWKVRLIEEDFQRLMFEDTGM